MIDLLVIAAIVAAALILASRQRASSDLGDYVLAGRRLTVPAFVATLVPSFYGGVLGVGEFTWRNGLSNWLAMAFPYYLFAAIYALALAGRVRLKEGLTIPDHIESAFGKTAAAWTALLVFWLACPADELVMLGTLLGFFTKLALPVAMLLVAAFTVALLLRGGLRADVGANRLQFVVMFAGFVLILPFAHHRIGGISALHSLLPTSHLSWTGGVGWGKILAWWLIAVWTLVDPSFHQRCAAARDGATARKGILISIGFWAVFDFMTTAAGLYARASLPRLENPVLAFPALADLLLPPVARGIFFAAMISSMLASIQSKCLLSALSLGKDGLGRLMSASEAKQQSWTKLALTASMFISLLLALAIPSVVGIWWAIGSTIIPGLLLPLLSVYFPRWRIRAPLMLASSIAGVVASLIWLILEQRNGSAPLGLAPMFPGLITSFTLWALFFLFP